MEKKLKLLSHFDDKYKGVALNAILYFIRDGGQYADEAICKIQEGIERQKKFGQIQGTNEQWDKYFKTIDLKTQLDEFYEALEYAEEWENKTKLEKEIAKAEQREYFGKQSMKGKEPTAKQITFLKSKGLIDIPNDRYECYEIIDKMTNL